MRHGRRVVRNMFCRLSRNSRPVTARGNPSVPVSLCLLHVDILRKLSYLTCKALWMDFLL